MQVWAVSDTVRVPETAPTGRGTAVSLYGAKNEYVSFQIMVRAAGGPLTRVVPQAGRLSGSGGRSMSLSSYHLYRETYQDVTKPSDPAGRVGLWPDGLVPIGRDPIVGEVRNGAPFSVAAERTQGVWIDLYIPLQLRAGSYAGTISVTAEGQPAQSVSVHLTVWNFSLPVKPSLPTAFGYDTWDGYRGHYGSVWDSAKIVRLTNLYSEAALQMRLSLFGINVAGPDYRYDASRQRSRAWTGTRLTRRRLPPTTARSIRCTADSLRPHCRFPTIFPIQATIITSKTWLSGRQ
jgi:hypothetical protein